MFFGLTKGREQASSTLKDTLFRLPLYPPLPRRNSKINVAAQELTNTISKTFSSFVPAEARKQLTKEGEQAWIKRGEDRALALFRAAAEHVPAYKRFLEQHAIQPAEIRTIKDFKKVPLTNKENYLRAYPLAELCWYGDLNSSQMISVSSGSSGQPFFWPRAQILDAETALEHELFLASFFELDKRSTLFIVCFAMGMYVAGPITLSSVVEMSRKGYPVTAVTPGYSPEDVLRIIPDLAGNYDQVVLAGYPPYIKEIIDQGIDHGIDWSKTNLRFLLAGEGFNESWRTYVAQRAGGKSPVQDFLNLYGSADAAVLAHETTASILVRRRIADDIKARGKLFSDERLPSLLQYHPEHKFFEEVDEELIFTAPGGIPLIRYNIHDRGGILTRQNIIDTIPELGEYFQQLEKDHKLWNLPFVYVFGKSDQTVILYGANVYPENIKAALEQEDVREQFTGRVVMYTDDDSNKDQRLHIEVECAPNIKPTNQLVQRMTQRIYETLIELNSEYRVVNGGIGDRTIPNVHLFPYGDERFRITKVKHAWTKKSGT